MAFELVCEPLDVVRAAERVSRVRDAALVADHLLRSDGDALRLFRRQRERLVVARESERLYAAERCRERLQGRAHDVVLRLLRGEGCAPGLDMRAEHPRTRVLCLEALAHDLRPHTAQRAVLRDLLEEVVLRVEDPRDARPDIIGADTALDRPLYISNRIGEGERHLLRGCAPGLSHVVAADAYSVKAR